MNPTTNSGPELQLPTPQPLAAPLAGPTHQSAPQPVVPNATNIVVPSTADDSDLIEKEWVAKAKQIVDRTRNDPHQQSEVLTHLKNDYMQKRYNKSIKLSE
jgi:hypothetical protein